MVNHKDEVAIGKLQPVISKVVDCEASRNDDAVKDPMSEVE